MPRWLLRAPLPAVAAVLVSACVGNGQMRSPHTGTSTAPASNFATAPAAAAATNYAAQVGPLIDRTLGLLSQPALKGRIHYFAGGVFHTKGFDCWRCDIALGTVAADLAREYPNRPRYRQLAVAAFNAMIRLHAYPNGTFGPGFPGEGGDGISTIVATEDLGVAYLELKPWLSHATNARWAASLRQAGVSIERQLGSYVNGNLNLAETLCMYLVYRATGDPAFNAAYHRSFTFTLHPPQNLWPGFGLQVVTSPNRPDDSDGAGYLAEKGTGAPGFDPHYTIVQSEIAATLFAVSHQARALRLLNLLTNALLTRTNRQTDLITTTGGSRRPAVSQGYLESPCLAVLAFADHRTDLAPVVKAQLHEISSSFPNYATRATDQNGVIGEFANVLLALPPSG
jgi:hypothetical protein